LAVHTRQDKASRAQKALEGGKAAGKSLGGPLGSQQAPEGP
jgi:hypothetical protein